MACGQADWPNADRCIEWQSKRTETGCRVRLPHILQRWVPLLVVSRAEGNAG